MNKFKTIVFHSTFILLVLFSACSSNSKVDDFLDKYESSVEKWEKIADSGNFSIDDITEMSKDNLELSSSGEKLKGDTEWTDSQKQRFIDLASRFSKAMMKMSKSKPNFNY